MISIKLVQSYTLMCEDSIEHKLISHDVRFKLNLNPKLQYEVQVVALDRKMSSVVFNEYYSLGKPIFLFLLVFLPLPLIVLGSNTGDYEQQDIIKAAS